MADLLRLRIRQEMTIQRGGDKQHVQERLAARQYVFYDTSREVDVMVDGNTLSSFRTLSFDEGNELKTSSRRPRSARPRSKSTGTSSSVQGGQALCSSQTTMELTRRAR